MMHYYRIKRGGTALVSKKQQMALRKCEKRGCDKPHSAYGLCNTHYMFKKRAESPELRAKDYENVKKWRAKNKEEYAAHQVKYRLKHKEKLSAYYIKWRNENRESFNAYQQTRKKRVKQATPKWADLKAIEEFYRNRPKGYHVDHIIPINGQNVCGLHVLENLQYLPEIDNLRKSNKT